MNKFLNFSTIVFSYVLITVLVISCGGSSGGSSGGSGGSSAGSSNSDGNDGNDGSSGNDGTSGGDGTDVNDGSSGGDGTDVNDGSSGNDGTSGGDGSDVNDGSSGGDGSDGSGNLPQADLNDKTCLLSDRDDKDAVAAVLCQGGSFIALITKTTPAGQEAQNINLLVDSVTDGENSTWNLNESMMIQMSYAKDYIVEIDASDGNVIGSLTAATEPTAGYLLQTLNIDSLGYDDKYALRSGVITFSPTSGSAIRVAIGFTLVVKTQQDFISMPNFIMNDAVSIIHDSSTSTYNVNLPFVLANNLDLIAPGGVAAKFDESIIPVATAPFSFDGGGKTITLKSAIDTTASDKPAAIIGILDAPATFKNFTLDINAPISGRRLVGTIVADSTGSSYHYETDSLEVFKAARVLKDINININSNLTVYHYQSSDDHYSYGYVYIGGLVGAGCFDINNVVVKTAKGAVIQAAVEDDGTVREYNVGGLSSGVYCGSDAAATSIKNSVVDVTLGASGAGGDSLNLINIGGLSSYAYTSVVNNIVKLAISRGNLPADFSFHQVGGLAAEFSDFIFYQRVGTEEGRDVTNNLVYADFSKLGKVKTVGGLMAILQDNLEGNNIANNMIFIADSFNTGNVTERFGAAVGEVSVFSDNPPAIAAANITNNFISSPVHDSDYNINSKLASFVHTALRDINFNYLILDNTVSNAMFKGGDYLDSLLTKVDGAAATNEADAIPKANVFDLSVAKTFTIATTLQDSNSWEKGSQYYYPQLKAPTDLSAANKADWDRINGLIQTGLAARANQ